MTRSISDAAEMLARALRGRLALPKALRMIRSLERKGNALARDLTEALLCSSLPISHRETLSMLIMDLDDTLDCVEGAAHLLARGRRRRVPPAARELGWVVAALSQELCEVIGQLHRPRYVSAHAATVRHLEGRGNELLRAALTDLNGRWGAVRDPLRWNDLCGVLEAATDRHADVATLLETLAEQTAVVQKGRLLPASLQSS